MVYTGQWLQQVGNEYFLATPNLIFYESTKSSHYNAVSASNKLVSWRVKSKEYWLTKGPNSDSTQHCDVNKTEGVWKINFPMADRESFSRIRCHKRPLYILYVLMFTFASSTWCSHCQSSTWFHTVIAIWHNEEAVWTKICYIQVRNLGHHGCGNF